jgi:Cu2+-exporting ATPase
VTLADHNDKPDWSSENILAICYQLEKQSEHPIAQAFMKYRTSQSPLAINNIKHISGQGVVGETKLGLVKLGNAQFTLQTSESNTNTELFITLDDQLIAKVELNDKTRTNVAQLFSALAALKIRTTIITGDPNPHKEAQFRELGLTDQYYCNVRPEQKLALVKEHLPNAAFVGDGINDGPVLAGAYVSIAVNNATDLSKTQADAILLNDNLATLLQAISTARKTHRIIKQNLAWALVYNLVALPVAAMGLISPWQAAIGMSISSLLVVGNAIRLRN